MARSRHPHLNGGLGRALNHRRSDGAAWPCAAPGGGGLSMDRLPPLTHVLGRLLFYYIPVRPCALDLREARPTPCPPPGMLQLTGQVRVTRHQEGR